MTMQEFIYRNRDELDRLIAVALRMSRNPRTNDIERKYWIMNDEGLYQWAKSEGVPI